MSLSQDCCVKASQTHVPRHEIMHKMVITSLYLNIHGRDVRASGLLGQTYVLFLEIAIKRISASSGSVSLFTKYK